MPCCCASNIKAAKILGIILAVLYGLGIVYDFTKPLTKGDIFSIVTGFLGVASASILAYAAFTRNSKAMLIYIYSTILMIILTIAGAIWVVVEVFNYDHYEFSGHNDGTDDALKTAKPIGLIIVVVIAIASILFDIWTIFVAKNAKKEIEAEK
jgi:lysylphosphatidylglycerol synthetase-like protein (DUF2156 family)